jgi:hypothetical protein
MLVVATATPVVAKKCRLLIVSPSALTLHATRDNTLFRICLAKLLELLELEKGLISARRGVGWPPSRYARGGNSLRCELMVDAKAAGPRTIDVSERPGVICYRVRGFSVHATPAKHLAFSPRALEVGGRGFQSCHIHQRNSRSPNHYAAFSTALLWSSFGTIGTTEPTTEASGRYRRYTF